MEQYIPITLINDFLFSKGSAYLQTTYRQFETQNFQDYTQVRGKIQHQNIEERKYSTKKNILMGISVYSEKYRIMGKIDIYDREKKLLIERKAKVKEIFDGYKYQLYAQYFCLKEMGEEVEQLQIRSMEDNKVYDISLPSDKEVEKFESIIDEIKNFDPIKHISNLTDKNVNMGVYKGLSW